jgi:hypothetical protein
VDHVGLGDHRRIEGDAAIAIALTDAVSDREIAAGRRRWFLSITPGRDAPAFRARSVAAGHATVDVPVLGVLKDDAMTLVFAGRDAESLRLRAWPRAMLALGFGR